MRRHLQILWDAFLGPMLQRPRRLQMAALCHRGDDTHREYLLVTSRDTGRWIIPKGWPIRGLASSETALREAWEEAGVREGKASDAPIGAYTYEKRRETGLRVPVKTLVYSVAVDDIAEDFPEARERARKWVSAQEAAEMVQEPDLKALFLQQ
ncbi:NUDIX hydrolase [Roseobacteraceae bacterium S113]